MAFRTETKTGACLILCCLAAAAAPPARYDVVHRHLRRGGAGVLTVDAAGISFTETGKGARHSRAWKFEDIQELRLGPDFVRIRTYEDNLRELGRDRVYQFDKTPPRLAADWYPVFRTRLDRRFVAALADPAAVPDWQLPAKLVRNPEGSHGVLLFAPDRIVYKTARPGQSRTWRLADIDNISTSGPFDLTLNTLEREFRFQLKQELPEARYQTLWMQLNRLHGLAVLR